MISTPPDLPQDLDACHALIGKLLEEQEQQQEVVRQQAEKIAEQDQTINEQQATIDRLTADVALLKRAMFGSRRERFIDDPRQGFLFTSTELDIAKQPAANEAKAPEPETGKPRRTSRGRGRRVFPDFLPRTRVEHRLNDEDIPADLRDDPSAKRFFKKTGEQLEYEPPKVHVLEHFEEVIVGEEDSGETTIVSAGKAPQLIDSYAGPGLLAYLTTSRFADHLPYYRQEDILSRIGFRIDRSTQWRWMRALSIAVEPLVDLMRRRVLESLVLGVDETPVRMLNLAALRSSVKSYLWGTVGDRGHPYDCFYFTANRARAGPDHFLSGFRGYLQSDAYICYERIALAHKGILKVACWAHARRKA